MFQILWWILWTDRGPRWRGSSCREGPDGLARHDRAGNCRLFRRRVHRQLNLEAGKAEVISITQVAFFSLWSVDSTGFDLAEMRRA